MAWEFKNDRPIYTQLLEEIQKMIISGIYKPGEKLPSVREFAVEASVNPNTMQRAMVELERLGLVYSNRTSGRIITEDRHRIEEVKMELAKELIKEFINNMKELGYGREEIVDLINNNQTIANHKGGEL